MERFAKRHLQVHDDLLGTDFGKMPSDSTFRLLLPQLDVDAFEALLKGWMAAQPGVAEGLDTLVCDGKTLRGSITDPPPAQQVMASGRRHLHPPGESLLPVARRGDRPDHLRH